MLLRGSNSTSVASMGLHIEQFRRSLPQDRSEMGLFITCSENSTTYYFQQYHLFHARQAGEGLGGSIS